jgi:hypothetical protein
MPRRTDFGEGWDEEGRFDGEGEPTVPCPYCRREILEDSPRCPYCENYISQEDQYPSRKPWWILLGILLGLCAVYYWIRYGW